MRTVLHLVPSLGGGGAETQLAYLCEGLAGRGWDVHVGHLVGGPRSEQFESSGADLHRIDSLGNYDPLIPSRIVSLIRRLRPAVVQTWIPMMDVLGGLSARLCGVPWILSERSSPQMFPTTAKFRLRAWLARAGAQVVSNSAGGDAYWADRVPASRRAVIGNALPLAQIEQMPAAPTPGNGLSEEAPLIVYVGRVTALKNVRTLVEALAKVVEQAGAVAVLCGDGDLRNELAGWVEERSLADRIAMPGFVPGVIGLLKRAACSISLSRYEGMPNAVMESMVVGCPLVVSEIPAHREILDDRCARFVDPDDPAAAASAMLEILGDPEAAEARAAVARDRAASWSIDAIARRYEQVYEQLLVG